MSERRSLAGPAPRVWVAVLNWRSAELTVACVESLQRLTYPELHLVIVDNGSGDDSVGRFRAALPDIPLLELPENRGYSAGNNAAIRMALERGADYVLLVNNDTLLVESVFVNHVVGAMERDPRAGIAGPRVLYAGDRVQETILFEPSLGRCVRAAIDRYAGAGPARDYGVEQEVEAVSGVCWCIRREVLETVGFLDEDYFLYAEEQDFCYRARRAGWKVIYYPVDSVEHLVGPDHTKRPQARRRSVYSRRNIALFMRKHEGRLPAMAYAGLSLSSAVLRALVARLRRRPDPIFDGRLVAELARAYWHVFAEPWKPSAR